MANSLYARTYPSEPGNAKIYAYNGEVLVGEIQEITYSITREMAPIYVIGREPPKPRGKRGIAGTIKFKYLDSFSGSELDDVPPFDILIRLEQDEKIIEMKILGVEILDEGIGYNFAFVNKRISEDSTVTFVAKQLTHLQNIEGVE